MMVARRRGRDEPVCRVRSPVGIRPSGAEIKPCAVEHGTRSPWRLEKSSERMGGRAGIGSARSRRRGLRLDGLCSSMRGSETGTGALGVGASAGVFGVLLDGVEGTGVLEGEAEDVDAELGGKLSCEVVPVGVDTFSSAMSTSSSSSAGRRA
ncbi:hypothetical protein BKA62DRAFT_85743 [Auriculariales sp. MPI-PUGE-AT-0066]|nr:hypothetical protein BKA62DRAFT_85743 [Auriculariales sp. MPI-PUGE-AT-0066]